MFTFIADLHSFISFKELSKFMILDPKIISFPFSASCGLFRKVCSSLYFWNLKGLDAEKFLLKLSAKQNVAYRSHSRAFPDALHSSNNLFRPFSASLVLLELFSDCLQNVTFLSSKSNSSIGNRSVGPDIFKLLEAAMIVCNLHTKLMLLCVALHIFCTSNLLACILESILHTVKNPPF